MTKIYFNTRTGDGYPLRFYVDAKGILRYATDDGADGWPIVETTGAPLGVRTYYGNRPHKYYDALKEFKRMASRAAQASFNACEAEAEREIAMRLAVAR